MSLLKVSSAKLCVLYDYLQNKELTLCQRTWVIAMMILKPSKVVVVDDNDQDAGENYDYGPIWLGL